MVAKIHNETDLTIADIICWKKSNAIPFQTSPTKLSRITELIYVFVKKEHLHTFKTNKEISKVNEKTGQKFYKNYVNYIEARNNDNSTKLNKATFSTELVRKLLNLYARKNSLIYDSFNGTGTTSVGCLIENHNYIGSEISKAQCEYAEKRLIPYKEQLKLI